jgi:hypothetical protein
MLIRHAGLGVLGRDSFLLICRHFEQEALQQHTQVLVLDAVVVVRHGLIAKHIFPFLVLISWLILGCDVL